MAFVTTTNSAAVAVSDNTVTVTSATSIVAGMFARIDGEVMQVAKNYVSGTSIPVQRGVDGSVTAAHKVSANITFGLASDWASPPPGLELGVTNPVTPAFPMFSYSAAGAITPVQGIHQLNGTTILAMTLASPTKDQDGQMILVVGNGKAAHTVTYTAGFGANTTSSDVLTFNANQTGAFWAVASNGVWVIPGIVAGAATVAGPGLG